VSAQRLQIRVLGELEVVRGDASVELPPSRKVRALLAYLLLTGRAHRRDRLCDLLWDVVDDPRAGLRWTLSRLRAVLEGDGATRIVADRTSVELDARDVDVDLLAVRDVVGRLGAAPVDELERAAARFGGELLEGLDLFDFDDFQAWLVAQRADARRLRTRLCRALIERLAGEPDRAAQHAARLVEADPLDETARTTLIRLLAAAGRHAEATQQLAAAQRAFRELGGREPTAVVELERSLRQAPAAAAPPPPAEPRRSPLARTTIHGLRLVGRVAEGRRLAAALDDVAARRRAAVKLIRGEPGVGKSRLLVALMTEARRRRSAILEGGAFEAEGGRAYGPWLDALRRLRVDVPAAASRDQLFEAVAGLVAGRVAEAPSMLIALDDLHWCDEGSVELLHYLVRSCSELPILFAVTARGGELADNAPALRALRSLRRAGCVEELDLGPLGRDETGELARMVQAELDLDLVFRESGGNPLFALEVARAAPRGVWSHGSSVSTVVRDRIDALAPVTLDVLRWAAVLGPVFRVRVLAELVALDAAGLADVLDDLDRHALIGGVVDVDEPGGTYQFSHHLVRRVVYGELSGPRRQLMHARAAEVLARDGGRGDDVAAELAHHAAEAGDRATAAEAYARAARHCQRLFATGQAVSLARRALRHADAVTPPRRDHLVAELEALIAEATR
jgi:DNA-binding SARP family transcriptional activator